MAVVEKGPVEKGPPPVYEAPGPDRPTAADLLFKEARRRERRRRLLTVGVAVIAAGAVVAAVMTTASGRGASSHPSTISTPEGPPSTGPAPGSIVPLHRAGALAVGPTGALYVSDGTRHQVLVRLADGRFRVVAGDGRAGFAGDGGPATRAELSEVSDMAFAPDGDLYLADGGRVRVIDRAGTIRTVAGDGRSSGVQGSVVAGTPALSAPLGPTVSLAFSPGGQLYVASQSQLFRVSADGTLEPLPAVLPPGPVLVPGALDSFTSIAVDSQGNVYASSLFDGWSVFEIPPDGTAIYLGYARRSGGGPGVVQRGADGAIEVDNGDDVMEVSGDHLVTTFAVTGVRGVHTFMFTDFFALAPDGTFYADNLGSPAYEPFQQIISVNDGRGRSLWRGASR